MHQIVFILIWLLSRGMAQKWHIDKSCAKWKEPIKAAMVEAITMAETALDVINNNGNDGLVKNMISSILDDNHPEDLEYAKILLAGVAGYSKTGQEEYNEAIDGQYFTRKTDLLIYCDPSNFNIRADGSVSSDVTGDELGRDFKDLLENCYVKPWDSPVMGITVTSSKTNTEKYSVAADAWLNSGGHGHPPDETPYITYQNHPGTLNLCVAILGTGADSMNTETGGYSALDDKIIRIVRSGEYMRSLRLLKTPVDGLMQSVSGVVLHELTHTDQGGRSLDSIRPPGCYGWNCVTKIKDQSNADSITALALVLTLWKKKRIWVNSAGVLEDVPGNKMRRTVRYLPRYPPVLPMDLGI